MTTALFPGGGPQSATGVGGANSGVCSLSFQNRVFPFRTNPNEIWWSYELITNIEETYGGRVMQILGTRIGDLTVKIDCGNGGWPYLMQVVLFLRDMLSDQRNGNVATFAYIPRNWKLNVYAMNIPFQDQMDATLRELTLNFKVQEDVTGVVGRTSMDATLARLQEGVYAPGHPLHNQYNDAAADVTFQGSGINQGGPSYPSSNITNNVDANPLGNNPGGVNPVGGLPGLAGIPGLTGLTGGLF